MLVAGERGSGRDTAVLALHELGATAGEDLVRLEPRAYRLDPNRAIPAAVYIDDIDRLDADGRAYWHKIIAETEADGFRRRPRVLASTAVPLPTLSADD